LVKKMEKHWAQMKATHSDYHWGMSTARHWDQKKARHWARSKARHWDQKKARY
jgi:hypothetical protein